MLSAVPTGVRARTQAPLRSRGLGLALAVGLVPGVAQAAPEAARAPPAEPNAATPSDDAAPDTDTTAAAPDTVPDTVVPAPAPPRIDGPYVGAVLLTGVTLAQVDDLDTDGPFVAFGGTLRFGEMVLPWLGLGLQVGGSAGVRTQDGARQSLGQGLLAVDFSFVPVPKRLPLSLRASFGFGGGAARQAGISGRSGFGGAMFGAAARYEWFPWAKKRRPYRGGGFALGPELGWIGFTPAAAGRPMSNTIYVALTTTFYFGS